MKPRLCACLFILSLATSLPAASLEEARLRWLKGNYEEAQSAYEELLKEAKHRSPASIGLSKALQSQGEYDKALTIVETALKDLPKDADLLARKAELLHLRGRWDEASKAVDAALAVKDKHLLAHWVRAQLYRDRGDVAKAAEEVKVVVRIYSAVVNTADEIKDPHKLQIRLTNNGVVMQNFNTDDMTHKIPRCIEWITSIHTLHPGDILATGTNHRGLNPFMDGDNIELTCEGCGTLHIAVRDDLKRT